MSLSVPPSTHSCCRWMESREPKVKPGAEPVVQEGSKLDQTSCARGRAHLAAQTMGLFKGAEAPSGVMKTFSPAATISQRIASYGTAVTVGVFIGAALTTGVACGVAGWWATSKVHVLSFLRTAAGHARSVVAETGLLGMTAPGLEEAEDHTGSGVGAGRTMANEHMLLAVIKQLVSDDVCLRCQNWPARLR